VNTPVRSAIVPAEVTVLAPLAAEGLLTPAEVHFAATFARLVPGQPDEVLVALAMAARGPRLGHVCIHPDDLSGLGEAAAGIDPAAVVRALESSPLVERPGEPTDGRLRPLVWDAGRLYLHRYHRAEVAVVEDLTRRCRAGGGGPTGWADPAAVEDLLDALFDPDQPDQPDHQRLAARVALGGGVSVIAGGPGTGKTRTVARLLAVTTTLAARAGHRLEIALATPTGKAAARMTEALHAAVSEAREDGVIDPVAADGLVGTTAVTLHRLLEHRPGSGFGRHAGNPLPHDLVVVDETSMVSLPLMAALLDAVGPDATVILVGDPHQLASIEAGTVMADIVGPGDAPDRGSAGASTGVLAGRVTVLRRPRRFGAGSGIATLAAAVRDGDAAAALDVLGQGFPDVVWVTSPDDPDFTPLLDEVVAAGVEAVTHAAAGRAEEALAAATRVKVLAATRHGPLGLHDWTHRIEEGVAAALPDLRTDRRWYVGRPVIVVANDYPNRLANGDVGIVVRRDGAHAVAFPAPDGPRLVPPARLDRIDTWWATTIHKSQGSEFPHAVVSLPRADSPILTRELLYTAVTRARERVTVVGDDDSVRAAIERLIRRASGLRDRLWPGS
jgi:exodeoxyribonuclease V alpha subunit